METKTIKDLVQKTLYLIGNTLNKTFSIHGIIAHQLFPSMPGKIAN